MWQQRKPPRRGGQRQMLIAMTIVAADVNFQALIACQQVLNQAPFDMPRLHRKDVQVRKIQRVVNAGIEHLAVFLPCADEPGIAGRGIVALDANRNAEVLFSNADVAQHLRKRCLITPTSVSGICRSMELIGNLGAQIKPDSLGFPIAQIHALTFVSNLHVGVEPKANIRVVAP